MAMKQKYGLSTPGREGQQGKWTFRTIWYFFVRKESMLYEWKIEHLWYFVQWWTAASVVRRLKKIHAEPKKEKAICSNVFFIAKFGEKELFYFGIQEMACFISASLSWSPRTSSRLSRSCRAGRGRRGWPRGDGSRTRCWKITFLRDFVCFIFLKKRRECIDSGKFVRLKYVFFKKSIYFVGM